MRLQSDVELDVDGGAIGATWTVPPGARGVVVFAHGSGSSRHSPRNQQVARALEDAGLATLLADLLTPEEAQLDEQDGSLRFDITFLARRVVQVIDALASIPRDAGLDRLPLGLFGASTGAAAALVAAATLPERVRAVVSRGGRPDLAGDALQRVRCPTLLIVGGRDEAVIELNERAERQLADAQLVIVPGATHLFPEPGALEQVCALTRAFFLRHLPGTSG